MSLTTIQIVINLFDNFIQHFFFNDIASANKTKLNFSLILCNAFFVHRYVTSKDQQGKK